MGITYGQTTEYIIFPDDMPPVIAVSNNKVSVDFDINTLMSPEQLLDLSTRFRMIPRQTLNSLIDTILVNIQGAGGVSDTDMREAVRTNLINIFNRVNLDEMSKQGVSDPWDWEQIKMEAQFRANAEKEFNENQPSIDELLNLESMTEKAFQEKRAELERRYVLLPQIADLELQLQRTLAFNLLLDKKSYANAENVLLFYETLSDDMKQVLYSTQ